MGKDNWPRVAVENLTVHTIFPLLLPGLLGDNVLSGIAVSLRFNLIHELGIQSWPDCFATAGLGGIGNPSGPLLPYFGLILQATPAVNGMALGRSFLISGDWQNGRPVKPFDHLISAKDAYFPVYPLRTVRQLKFLALRECLLEEVVATLTRLKWRLRQGLGLAERPVRLIKGSWRVLN